MVSVHGRYNVNWEWGAWIEDESCHHAIAFTLANGYTTPAYLSTLYVEKNNAFHTFQQQQRQLCEAGLLCDFDYIEGDFTGVLVGPGHFPDRPLKHASALIVTNIAESNLHRDEHPMGTDPPRLPNEIPEKPQQ
ncbi:MAG TPA: hypothetical protein VGG15_01185 [Terriglobales bacterium]